MEVLLAIDWSPLRNPRISASVGSPRPTTITSMMNCSCIKPWRAAGSTASTHCIRWLTSFLSSTYVIGHAADCVRKRFPSSLIARSFLHTFLCTACQCCSWQQGPQYLADLHPLHTISGAASDSRLKQLEHFHWMPVSVAFHWMPVAVAVASASLAASAAMCSSMMRTHSALPARLAIVSAVSPPLSRNSVLAPSWSRRSTIAGWSNCAACISAVKALESRRSTSAPRSSSVLTTRSWPKLAASIKAVLLT
mmetsp:Transcript_970/g.2889  ORF Transcript_970/g.2889 Transcript_970/m.2889 type:complete len:251 (+) Transcript_970:587-1339(+)